jgi:hypothetical protein
MIHHLDAVCRFAIENPQGIRDKTPLAVLAETILFSSEEIA